MAALRVHAKHALSVSSRLREAHIRDDARQPRHQHGCPQQGSVTDVRLSWASDGPLPSLQASLLADARILWSPQGTFREMVVYDPRTQHGLLQPGQWDYFKMVLDPMDTSWMVRCCWLPHAACPVRRSWLLDGHRGAITVAVFCLHITPVMGPPLKSSRQLPSDVSRANLQIQGREIVCSQRDVSPCSRTLTPCCASQGGAAMLGFPWRLCWRVRGPPAAQGGPPGGLQQQRRPRGAADQGGPAAHAAGRRLHAALRGAGQGRAGTPAASALQAQEIALGLPPDYPLKGVQAHVGQQAASSPTLQAECSVQWGDERSLLLQLFLLKAESLEAATYYVGVFNEDYYVHQSYAYTLQVCC